MDKLLAGQILHSSGHLQPEAHQILHCRVLKQNHQRTVRLWLNQCRMWSQLQSWNTCMCFFMCPYMSLISDKVAQVAMLHVGQNHQWWTLWRQADPQQRENVGVAEVLHDDPLLQELGHLFQICDAFIEKNKHTWKHEHFGPLTSHHRVSEGQGELVMCCIFFWEDLLDYSGRWRVTLLYWHQLEGHSIRTFVGIMMMMKIKQKQMLKNNPPWISPPSPDQTPIYQLHPCCDALHFGPTDSAVIWLKMEALYVWRNQLTGLQLRLDPKDGERWYLLSEVQCESWRR